MNSHLKRRGILGIAVGGAAYAVPYLLAHFGMPLIARVPPSLDRLVTITVLLTLLFGIGVTIWGCRCYALAKGQSPIWAYLGFVPPAGILVAFLLKDRHPEIDDATRRGFPVKQAPTDD